MIFDRKICFYTYHRTYITCNSDDILSCTSKTKGPYEAFEIIKVGDKVAIKTTNGKYLSAQSGYVLKADKTEISDSEKFIVENAQDGQFNFKTCLGRYVCASENGHMEADREKALEWERLKIVKFELTKEEEEQEKKLIKKKEERLNEVTKRMEEIDKEIKKLEDEKRQLKNEERNLREEIPGKRKVRWHPQGKPEPPPGKHWTEAPSCYSREFGTDWMLASGSESD